MLLGGYSSGEEGDVGPRKATAAGARPAGAEGERPAAHGGTAPAAAPAKAKRPPHGPFCPCDECEALMARFTAKSVQTKGIRFRCKLCSHLAATKATASDHFRAQHPTQLQNFKQEKDPRLFTAAMIATTNVASKISFAREDVLRKRPRDDAVSFGGFSLKPKIEPPPCEQPDFQAMTEPVIQAAAPWVTQSRPSNDDATVDDKAIDKHIAEAQMKRFSNRNILEVKRDVVRCKLCMKTFGSSAETDRHIRSVHEADFQKEIGLWERFLHMHCKRQPPFGWVCKICSTFFPTDGAVWRHLGKEVFVRQEERHIVAWREKEDRWGHEEDGECCGDGMNASGLSYDSVRMFNQQAQQEELEGVAKQVDGGKAAPDGEGESGEEAEDGETALGVKQFIQEF